MSFIGKGYKTIQSAGKCSFCMSLNTYYSCGYQANVCLDCGHVEIGRDGGDGDVARDVVMIFFRDYGQSAHQRLLALNNAIKAAGFSEVAVLDGNEVSIPSEKIAAFAGEMAEHFFVDRLEDSIKEINSVIEKYLLANGKENGSQLELPIV